MPGHTSGCLGLAPLSPPLQPSGPWACVQAAEFPGRGLGALQQDRAVFSLLHSERGFLRCGHGWEAAQPAWGHPGPACPLWIWTTESEGRRCSGSAPRGEFWLLHVGVAALGQPRGLCFVNDLFDTSHLNGRSVVRALSPRHGTGPRHTVLLTEGAGGHSQTHCVQSRGPAVTTWEVSSWPPCSVPWLNPPGS